ncbi:MAG: putative Ig domain-containing protein [Steroidobacteraceae bacterium]
MQVSKPAALVLASLSLCILAGCLDKKGPSVTQSSPATPVTPGPGTGGNQPPTITGTPPTAAVMGTNYSFQPVASDPNKDPLAFSIANRPTWASFDAKTGLLAGVPTATGTFANVTISVSDGSASAALSPFSISVANPTPTATGSATLSWVPPSQKTDGSPLANLAGFRVYYGKSATALSNIINLSNPGTTSYTITPLTSGTYYFTVTAYDMNGAESAQPSPVSKTIA